MSPSLTSSYSDICMFLYLSQIQILMWERIQGGKKCPIKVRIDEYNTKNKKTWYVRTDLEREGYALPSLGDEFLLLVREKIERGGNYQFFANSYRLVSILELQRKCWKTCPIIGWNALGTTFVHRVLGILMTTFYHRYLISGDKKVIFLLDYTLDDCGVCCIDIKY